MERVQELNRGKGKGEKEKERVAERPVDPEEEKVAEEKDYSKLEWFFYIIFIPSLFTLIMVSVILSFFHINVWESAKGAVQQIPFVNQWISPGGKEEKKISPEEALKQQLAESEKKLADATTALNQQKAKVQQQDQEIAQLKQQLADALKSGEEKKATQEERRQKAVEMAKMLTGMNASKAASILDQLTLHEAAVILSQMKESDRSTLMSKLDPKKAADLTALLYNTPYSENLEVMALQERVDQLTTQLDDLKLLMDGGAKNTQGTTATLRNAIATFQQMSPSAAAAVLETMWKNSERKNVLSILAGIDPKVKAPIIAAMDPKVAAQINQAFLQ
ncbi:magnesium transporter MgtE N-terminal domain-containing protein [Thermicanus aegyptius]|uniref:magnesium transporter MgtE N-terminal domain-containing protein n=1 Tax=Thermicanus aegyptius TaxID=94009 RepID=UPI0004024F22|nr:hypothetical protein [Thermicanus aegyptius]